MNAIEDCRRRARELRARAGALPDGVALGSEIRGAAIALEEFALALERVRDRAEGRPGEIPDWPTAFAGETGGGNGPESDEKPADGVFWAEEPPGGGSGASSASAGVCADGVTDANRAWEGSWGSVRGGEP